MIFKNKDKNNNNTKKYYEMIILYNYKNKMYKVRKKNINIESFIKKIYKYKKLS